MTLPGGGTEVGHIYARLDAVFDDDGFQRFDRAYDSTRREARRPVSTRLAADFDSRGFRQYDSAVRGAHTRTNQLSSASGRAAGTLKRAAVTAGTAAAAYMGIYQARSAVTTTLDLAKTTKGLEANLFGATKEASRWAIVAKARDIDARQLNMSFGTLAKNIDAATHGGTEQAKLFERLGISTRELKANSDDFGESILDVSGGLDQMGTGGERTSIAMRLMGRGWQTILPLMRDGRKSLEDNLGTVDDLNAAMGKDSVDSAMKLVSAQREAKIATTALQLQFTKALTPALLKATDQFTELARIMGDKSLSDDEKFAQISEILQEDFNKVVEVGTKMIPELAKGVGEQAPKVAGALVEGFLNANIWGKLLIGSWFLSKLGGWSAVSALGRMFGIRFGTAAAPGIAAGVAEGATAGAGIGAAGGAAAGAGGAAAAGGAGGMLAGARGLGRFALRGAGPVGLAVGAGMLVDELGVFDAGGPLADTFVGGILGIGDETLDEKIAKLDALAGAIKDVNKAGQDVKPGKIRELDAALEELGSGGAHAIDKLKKQYGTLGNAGAAMSKKQREAWKDLALTARQQGELTSEEYLHFINALDRGSNRGERAWERLAKANNTTAKQMREDTGTLARKYIDYLISMGETNTDVLQAISDDTNKELKKWGVPDMGFIRSRGRPGGVPAGAAGAARGGRVAGYSTTDNVPVMLRGGERVLRPEDHSPVVDLAMMMSYGVGLDAYLKSTGGQGYGRGGRVTGLAGGGMVTGDTDFLPALGSALSRMAASSGTPIYVKSGRRTMAEQQALYARYLAGGTLAAVPNANAPHVRGVAADITPGREVFGGMAGRFGMGFTVPSESWHIEILGAGGGSGSWAGGGGTAMAVPELPHYKITGGGGHHRALVQKQVDSDRKAAQKLLEKKAPAGTGETGNLMSADGSVAEVFAQVARRRRAGHTPTLALFEAGLAESGMRDLPGGDASSQGSLQLLASTASSMGIDPHNEGQVADAFLTRGFTGRGGAIQIAGSTGLPAHLVAQAVQGSAFSSGSNYAAQAGAAQALMRRFGFARGGRVGPLARQLRGLGGLRHYDPENVHDRERALRHYQRAARLGLDLSALGPGRRVERQIMEALDVPHRIAKPKGKHAMGFPELAAFAQSARRQASQTMAVARAQRGVSTTFAAGGRVGAPAAPTIILRPVIELHAHGSLGPVIDAAEAVVEGRLHSLARRANRARQSAGGRSQTVFGRA